MAQGRKYESNRLMGRNTRFFSRRKVAEIPTFINSFSADQPARKIPLTMGIHINITGTLAPIAHATCKLGVNN
jgi:hypothetical protein